MTIVIERSRTNISEKTRTCIGTSDRACNVTIDCSAGRLRCRDCRIEQRDIDKRKRNARDSAERRTREAQRVTCADGLHRTMKIKIVEGISGLPLMGIAGHGPAAIIVIRERFEWREISMQEIDEQIASKTRKYLDKAEELLKKPGGCNCNCDHV